MSFSKKRERRKEKKRRKRWLWWIHWRPLWRSTAGRPGGSFWSWWSWISRPWCTSGGALTPTLRGSSSARRKSSADAAWSMASGPTRLGVFRYFSKQISSGPHCDPRGHARRCTAEPAWPRSSQCLDKYVWHETPVSHLCQATRPKGVRGLRPNWPPWNIPVWAEHVLVWTSTLRS